MKRKGLVFALVLALSVMAFAPMAVAGMENTDAIECDTYDRMVQYLADINQHFVGINSVVVVVPDDKAGFIAISPDTYCQLTCGEANELYRNLYFSYKDSTGTFFCVEKEYYPTFVNLIKAKIDPQLLPNN